jgi:arginase family enzyme
MIAIGEPTCVACDAGLRDVEDEEWSHIHSLSIAVFSMKQIDRIGIAVAVQTALHTVDPLGVGNFSYSC